MRSLRLGGLVLMAAASVAVISCPNPYPYPGTQIVTFTFEARPSPGGVAACLDAGYTEVPLPDASFTFLAIFSGEEDGTIRWMTLQEYVRDATWDGVLLSSAHSGPRFFGLCGDAGVDEEFFVAPISLEQSRALRGQCPPDPTAPGAIPLDPDAGIGPPGWFNGQFEAVSACGVLRDTIHEVGDRPCPTCTMQFDVTGIRL